MQNCFVPADILLPGAATPLDPWACIAVDQFTSQPEYWQKAEELAKGKPSTLHIVLPEAYLGTPQEEPRLAAIRAAMQDYRDNLLTRCVHGYVYVERTQMDGTIRQGLVGAVDLEQYSFKKGSKPAIRPSESTVVARIPPRLKIRRGAQLETPHVMMLADDEACTLIEPIAAHKAELPLLYDCALMLNVMAGFDERDSTSLDRPAEDYTRELGQSLAGLKVGLPREFFTDGLDAEVARVVDATVAELKRLGASIVEVSLPKTELSIPAYYVIAPAEASSNLSRYDGVRYGHRAAEYRDLTDMYEKSRAEGFGAEVKRRILMGTYVLSHGYYDAYYLQAQKIRRLLADDFRAAFAQCDVILGPVAPTPAWNLGEKGDDPVAMYLADIYTLAVNLAGLPGMSMPAGFSASGRPIGVQLIGNYFREAQLLNVAHQFQQSTDWHRQAPAS